MAAFRDNGAAQPDTLGRVPQYWLKPMGVTRPFSPIPNDYLDGADLDRLRMMSGPSLERQPPEMGPGDRVLLHAVDFVRVFAEGEILEHPKWERDPVWGVRWPWVYLCRVDTWVPLVEDGLKTTAVAPGRAIRRIQAGGAFANLSREEYRVVLSALQAVPAARRRATV